MGILLFGTGNYYQRYRDCFADAEVVGLLDNDASKQGRSVDGVRIYSPEEIRCLDYQQIYLLSANTKEMRKQLTDFGVNEDCIFEVTDIYRGLKASLAVPDCMMYGADNCERKAVKGEAVGHIVILTPNLSLNGAEVALCHMVRVLLDLGYSPMVASFIDGYFRTELTKMGIPVMVMGSAAHVIPLSRQRYLEGAQAYVLNTIEMYLLLQERKHNIPILWWLHDSDMVYQETHIRDEFLRKLDLCNIRIKAVSEIALEAFVRHCETDCQIGIMPYGLEDWAESKIFMRKSKKRLTFGVMGGLTKRKAQGDFIRAVSLLPKSMRKACRFVLVGHGGGEMLAELQKQAEGLPIEFFGELDRNSMLSFYAQDLDVLVCPSLSDTLPIVTVEAMMFRHPVIASDAVGTSGLLIEYDAGLVVPVGTPDKLATAMIWMYEHPKRRDDMGIAARKIYEERFSLDGFRRQVDKVMRGILRNEPVLNCYKE